MAALLYWTCHFCGKIFKFNDRPHPDLVAIGENRTVYICENCHTSKIK